LASNLSSVAQPGPSGDVVVMPADALHDRVRRILLAAGADQRNAERVAEALVSADVCGVGTHGVWHLDRYVAAIKSGEIVATAWPEVLFETPTTALVSGNWAFGHVTAKYAMDVAIAKAEKQTVAVVGAVKLCHIGRLGEYVELAASRGMISQLWGGGFSEEVPFAVPYGGRKRALNTNPVAMAFPYRTGAQMMFDFATTATAAAKIYDARDQNKALPPGCIVDKDGNPTTDATAFFDGGAQVPFGGHKGYGFMLAAEFLGMVLTGSSTYADSNRGGPIFRCSGASIIVFKSDLFRPVQDYMQQADSICARMKNVPPAPGFIEVLVPGELEARARAVRLRDGVPIPREMWNRIAELPMI
jgi:hydroxycarboxylate dehydrogenase B